MALSGSSGMNPAGNHPRLFKLIVSNAVEINMKKWINESTSVNIFVTGKTGTGKSSLVNGIVGKQVAEEGGTLDPQTDKVTSYKITIDGITVTVWDSPGLQDGTKREDEYIADIKRNCTDVDLFIYCIRMSETRFVRDNRDIRAMHILNDTLSMAMWRNAVFVLSFANDVVDTGEEDYELTGKELEDYFNTKLTDWTEKLRQTLEDELGIPDEIAQRVRVIPAGYYASPQLIKKSGDFWLSKLWMGALYAASSKAQPALIKINEQRLKTIDEVGQEGLEKDLLLAQPIIFADKGAMLGAQFGMPQLGALHGFEVGLDISARLLLELGLQNKFVTGEDINLQGNGDMESVATDHDSHDVKGC